MKIVEQNHKILSLPENLKMLETAGRTCYKSEDKITEDSANDFANMLIRRGHHAMIEFGDIIVKFVTNRGVTHELVRHRPCSFAQESTRYVKYDGEMEFIKPEWCSRELLGAWSYGKTIPTCIDRGGVYWINSMLAAEENYRKLLKESWKAQQAREVLPNSLKTEIVVKANFREWRHIFSLRCSNAAHPQMFGLMRPLLAELKEKIPVVFDDIWRD